MITWPMILHKISKIKKLLSHWTIQNIHHTIPPLPSTTNRFPNMHSYTAIFSVANKTTLPQPRPPKALWVTTTQVVAHNWPIFSVCCSPENEQDTMCLVFTCFQYSITRSEARRSFRKTYCTNYAYCFRTDNKITTFKKNT